MVTARKYIYIYISDQDGFKIATLSSEVTQFKVYTHVYKDHAVKIPTQMRRAE